MRHCNRRPPLPPFAAIAAVLPLVFGEAAVAQQALERNAPAPEQPSAAPVAIAAPDFGAADTTPLGVALIGVRLIAADERVTDHRPDGVTLGAVGGVPKADVEAALRPFLARPLSRKLIAEMRTAVAGVWREAGFPFVSVTVPPQEVTSGVVHLRVVEFRMGAVSVLGAEDDIGAAMSAGLRVVRGERIDAARLNEDLEWLNRVPYRRVEGVFAPGDETATSDLTLKVTRIKPWQMYAGWSNTGTETTGRDRFFVGGGAWIVPLGDVTLTYQVTGSDDLRSPRKLFPDSGGFARYLSHAGRLVLATRPRQAIEFAPALVATRETAGAFIAFENQTVELPIIYRSALSNIVPGLHAGNIYTGAEIKRLERTTFFNGMAAAKGRAEVFQFVLGWSHILFDDHGRTTFDIRLKHNPGGVMSDNSTAMWRAFSGGRVIDPVYTYGAFQIDRLTTLPGGFSWLSQLAGGLAEQPLPDTERITLGGLNAVRSHRLDDTSIDAGLIWRNDLRAPAMRALGATTLADTLSPYLFIDAGHGVDRFTGGTTTLAGAGAGFDYDLGAHANLSFSAGRALRDGGRTDAGDWTVYGRITARY